MYATTTVQLIEKNGELYTPKVAVVDALLKEFYSNDPIIICRHDAGDVDTIKFPAYNADNLRSALFDDREMGVIPFVKSVLLPDGKEFVIDAPVDKHQDGASALEALSAKYEKSLRNIIYLCETKTTPCACKFADEGSKCLYCETKLELANLAAIRS